ncbi:MAG: hypothetical protein KJ573_10540 [Proteobacteria bacterium]|nr:hypothetical protein [Pseudomonadota bacterium]MBU1904014.1 hypothetical protein [Pseudomonadota bacterium]
MQSDLWQCYGEGYHYRGMGDLLLHAGFNRHFVGVPLGLPKMTADISDRIIFSPFV